ncbi:hypothetical protein GCM10029964_078400 [Kibdelosporangium lantanae]
MQYVIRSGEYRGYAGQVASGTVRIGDEVVVLPAGSRTHIAGIDTPDGPLAEAVAGRSVTLLLADDIDVGRGDMIAAATAAPTVTSELAATVCWLADEPLRAGARVLVKHGTRTVQGLVTELRTRIDETDLSVVEQPETLALNDIGEVSVLTSEPLPVDEYVTSRRTGAFLLIDRNHGGTLAAGMTGSPLPVLGPPVA